MSPEALRTTGIVVAIAAVVAFLPGGDSGAALLNQLLGAVFVVAMAWGASVLFRRFRREIDGLGDRYRAVLYASLAALVVGLAWTDRLWSEGSAGPALWAALMGAGGAGVYRAWQQHRSYGL